VRATSAAMKRSKTTVSVEKEEVRPPREALQDHAAAGVRGANPELVIITGLSGSGKGTVLRVFEDLGYYAVDNLPIDLIPTFASLCRDSPQISRAALVVDIREGEALRRFPEMFRELQAANRVLLLFLEASDEVLQRRYSETRRPHPLGTRDTVLANISVERDTLGIIQNLADLTIDTSQLNIHELRRVIISRFSVSTEEPVLLVTLRSFGFKHGVPTDSDLVFDVRFLPNPNYVPGCKNLNGKHPKVIQYIRSFPQTGEFIGRVSELLIYLMPHYAREGKSYLTISFGCTGGRHRSVMIAEAVEKNLSASGCKTAIVHRDIDR
jgi:RNase adapter protein RapZ